MRSVFSLEILPAEEGDCLLLHWGDGKDDKKLGVIDGGPAKVYERTLRPRLMDLRRHFGLDTLSLAFVMVSHVDNDHIIGVKKLFAELRTAVSKNTPKDQRPLHVERLWHNAFTDILGDGFDAYYAKASLVALAAHAPAVEAALSAAGLDGIDGALALALVLAGHGEGRVLRDDHAQLYAAHEIQRLNAPFAKAGRPVPIMRFDPLVATPVDGLQLRIIGPSQKELIRLKADFEGYLKEKGLAVPAALVAALEKDSSPTNLSSIVCLVERDTKRILLTGDALGEKILAGLAEAGQLKDGRIEVDILKVPHHGSARNTAAPFFDTIHAKNYVFSANGRHENPDRATIDWLIASRKPTDAYRIVFTYPVRDIDTTRQAIRTKKGESWDPDRDAIAPLLHKCRSAGYAFSWSEGRAILDLGDVAMKW